MTTNKALQFRYPTYSEIFNEERKKIEEFAKIRLEKVKRIQPFYEECIALLRKYPLPCDTNILVEGLTITYKLHLAPNNHILEIKPLLDALCAHFKRETFKPTYESTMFRMITWRFLETQEHITHDRCSITLSCHFDHGVLGIETKEVDRVITTTDYIHHIHPKLFE